MQSLAKSVEEARTQAEPRANTIPPPLLVGVPLLNGPFHQASTAHIHYPTRHQSIAPPAAGHARQPPHSSMASKDYDADRPESDPGFETISLHHGQTLDPVNRARAPPIYASTSFAFEDAAHGADLFALKKLGPIYTRIMNPTNHVLEYRIAKLEGSGCDLDTAHPSALATASGMSAQMVAITTICKAGDHIIAASDLYGGTYAQMTNLFPSMGLETSLIDGGDLAALKAAFKENTKAVYYETIGNPSFEVPDFEGVSAICKEMQVPLIVDNTFGMCGLVCRPFKYGANIITESCTSTLAATSHLCTSSLFTPPPVRFSPRVRLQSGSVGTGPPLAGSLLTQTTSTGRSRWPTASPSFPTLPRRARPTTA